jgi:hypothetical protein
VFARLVSALRRIQHDLRNRRNLVEYISLVAAAALILLDIFTDVIPTTTQLSLIIFLLGVLVFQTTVPKAEAADLDGVLKTRNEFGKYSEYIAGRKTVWILATSGINLSFADLKQQVLDKGGSVRLLLLDPDELASIAYLSDQLEPTANLQGDLVAVIGRLRKMNWPGLEYRLGRINPGFSMTILNAGQSDGLVTVEFYGYRSDLINNRMHIDIPRQSTQFWFDYWVRQYELMWNDAHEDLG